MQEEQAGADDSGYCVRMWKKLKLCEEAEMVSQLCYALLLRLVAFVRSEM